MRAPPDSRSHCHLPMTTGGCAAAHGGASMGPGAEEAGASAARSTTGRAGPVTDPLSAETSPSVARSMRDALHRGRLVAERDAILAVVPPDPSAHIWAAEVQRSRLQRDRDDLVSGRGRYRDHPSPTPSGSCTMPR